MERFDQIIQLILVEAEEVDNPDPVSRIYNVDMKASSKLMEIMEKIREQQKLANLSRATRLEPFGPELTAEGLADKSSRSNEKSVNERSNGSG